MKELTLGNIPQLPFSVTEALNQLRVNLGFCGDNIKTIMITSSVPNEGKSFVALGLWKMMAEVGMKTLLIDCDMRNSTFRTKYAISGENLVGLAHHLSGKRDLLEVLYKTNVPNGYMIPVIANVVTPTILLERDRLGTMIERCAQTFDFIIIDTPPLGKVADAMKIAPYCDGSLLVVGSGAVPRKMVNDSIQLLRRTETPLLGTVLNRVPMNKVNNRYYNNYGYYYGKHGYGRGHGYGYGYGEALDGNQK